MAAGGYQALSVLTGLANSSSCSRGLAARVQGQLQHNAAS